MHSSVVQILFPIVMTVVLVGAALLTYWVTRNNVGRYLFEAPAWAVREPAARPSQAQELESASVRDFSPASR